MLMDAICPVRTVIDGSVYIVQLALDRHRDGARFLPLLDFDERTRAAAFKFKRDRRRFAVAHGLMRIVLGSLIDVAPEQLRFRLHPNGKPMLDNDSSVEFNLSHSGERAVLAVTRGREVGIDIEQERPIDPCALARSFFAAGERKALDAMAAADRLGAFFKVWTRKESFVKALGAGLSFPLDGFTVSLDDDAEQLLVDCTAAPSELRRWRMTRVPTVDGYAAAITVKGSTWQPTYCEFGN